MEQRRRLQRLVALEVLGCLLVGAAFVFVTRRFGVHPATPVAPAATGMPASPSVTPLIGSGAFTPGVTLAAPLDAPPGTSSPPAPSPVPAGLVVNVSADGDYLRLRKDPGTFGEILGLLGAGTPLAAVGRTADGQWLEVDTDNQRHGWVLAEFIDAPPAAAFLPVTGQALVPPAAYPAYISGISTETRELYRRGQALGNRADVFTKVGDSITVSPDFLIPVGQGRAVLYGYQYLRPAIDYFSAAVAREGNSFVNPSLAAKNGWSAWTVLDANYRDATLCAPGESPLGCEYRVVRPAIALILLGTNDAVNSTLEAYQANLSAIVQTSIDLGVIPVLTTIPERLLGDIPASRVADFNAVIPAVARTYGVPLWDYRLTLAGLPNKGVGDTVHPSSPPNGNAADFSAQNLQYGYPLRNLGALEVLNALWRNVIAAS